MYIGPMVRFKFQDASNYLELAGQCFRVAKRCEPACECVWNTVLCTPAGVHSIYPALHPFFRLVHIVGGFIRPNTMMMVIKGAPIFKHSS